MNQPFDSKPSSNSAQAQSDSNGKQSFQISAPSISLPKGGGAIRGIGEKFAANPVTGTGSMTVPIATSLAVLALVRNSRSPTTPAGGMVLLVSAGIFHFHPSHGKQTRVCQGTKTMLSQMSSFYLSGAGKVSHSHWQRGAAGFTQCLPARHSQKSIEFICKKNVQNC
ncbi:MAG: hypothetical protein WD688_27255 [Candidatus Binatia bacterium]